MRRKISIVALVILVVTFILLVQEFANVPKQSQVLYILGLLSIVVAFVGFFWKGNRVHNRKKN